MAAVAACSGQVDRGEPPLPQPSGIPGDSSGTLGQGTGGLVWGNSSGGVPAEGSLPVASGGASQFLGGESALGGSAMGGAAIRSNASGALDGVGGGASDDPGSVGSSAGTTGGTSGALPGDADSGNTTGAAPREVPPDDDANTGGSTGSSASGGVVGSERPAPDGTDTGGSGSGAPAGDAFPLNDLNSPRTAAPDSDGCGSVPLGGECVTDRQARFCVAPTGEAEPTVVIRDCAETEACVATEIGARCVARPSTCSLAGDSECADDRTLRVCSGSSWNSTPCSGMCRTTVLGSFCTKTTETTGYTATIRYETRTPNETYTDWSDVATELPLPGALVASYRGEELIDAALTDASGAFTVGVPSPMRDGDRIFTILLHPSSGAAGYNFAIGVPDVEGGTASIYQASSARSGVWNWQIDPLVTPTGSTQVITAALGSGAARLFDVVQRSTAEAEAMLGTPGKGVIVWLRMNTDWRECSACFMSAPAFAGTLRFESQIFIPAIADNEAFWSEALITHELGHWAMWSFGVSPREGGTHCLGVPTQPGQAWSEGWATGFSSASRQDPLFYDKQSGTMYWIDLATRSTPFGAWARPAPEDGLLQPMDENEVAAMVWGLASHPDIGAMAVTRAIGSHRMTERPFARGYTRHSWTMDGCTQTASVDSGESVPMVADFLDALVCAGAPPSAVDAVIQPSTFYPYSSSTPLCEAP